MMLLISNIAIVLFGILASYFTNLKESDPLRKYAPIAGLIAQPFWCYILWVNFQWGIFVLTVVYTLCWLNGLRNCWFTK